MAGEKLCSCCKQTKPLVEFPRNRSTRTGWASACTSCAVDRNRRYLMIDAPRTFRGHYRKQEAAASTTAAKPAQPYRQREGSWNDF